MLPSQGYNSMKNRAGRGHWAVEWIASAAFGLEGPVAGELRALGLTDVRPQDTGGVRFSGAAADAFRADLWLRTADRVLLIACEGEVRTFEELFRLARDYAWEAILPRDARFPVRAHCARSQLMSPSDCQAIVKKAVADRLSAAHRLSWLPEDGAEYAIDVSIRRDRALICLDTSGDALNRRGYRTWNGEAPLRETLAAALVRMSPWRPGMTLWDPMCGTGSIALEAALMAADRAPGLARSFAIERWTMLDAGEARAIRAEAERRFRDGMARECVIGGSDIDPAPLELARRHAKQSGMADRVTLLECDAREAVLPAERGVIVTNPPYGERLGDRKTALDAAEALGAVWRRYPGWTVCAISPESGFERAFGRRADRRRRLYNGRIECEYMTFLCQNLQKRST